MSGHHAALPDPTPGTTPLGLPQRPRAGGQPSLQVFAPDGHGALSVSSDALLVDSAALARLSENLRLAAGELAGVLERDQARASIAFDVPIAALEARRVMDAALHQLMVAQRRADAIHDGIVRSREAYERGEELTLSLMHSVDEQVAWGLGQAVRIFALPLGVTAVASLVAACVIFRMSPGELAHAAQSLLKAHGRILTNPYTVAAIREIGSDVDGFSDGLIGLPPGVSTSLSSSGITGIKSSAEEVVLVANLGGLFRETSVSVRKTRSYSYTGAPTSLVDRAVAIPNPHDDANGEQIRIDRYVTPGQPDRYDVYIAGTVTFDPTTKAQPFDFTSDMRGVAGRPTASVHAVEEAMAGAGVTSTSPVMLNGYSQGGLVASAVAASGAYNVKGVVTFGAPSGQVQLPAHIPVLSVRNSEDLVPATSGYDVNRNAVIVEHSVFSHSPVPSTWAVPGHRLEYYEQTASIVDTSNSPRVRSILATIDGFGSGAHHTETSTWLAVRTSTDTIDTGEAVPTDATLASRGADAR